LLPGAPERKTGKLRAHDVLVTITSGIFSRAILMGLGAEGAGAADAIDEICAMWKHLLQPLIKPEDVEDMANRTYTALAAYEQHLPRSELAIMVHLAGHLPSQISDYGPLR